MLILLGVTKLFLIDLGTMDGLWSALSFIGLDGVLIGLLYQKVVPRFLAKDL